MFPKIPLGDAVEWLIAMIRTNFRPVLRGMSDILSSIVSGLINLLGSVHPLILILLLSLLVWKLTNRKTALLTLFGFLLIENLGLWPDLLITFVLVLVATFISLVIGIPLGIACARSNRINSYVTPVLDLMQTMPAFVYLIPAVMFFRVGSVPAIVATFIFSVPPTIRLTNLGIRQVPTELIEAADSFGATPRQKLIKVQLPLALPTIMAGVNQCIMLALSMAVIAAMVGAGGLGRVVWSGIQTLDVGLGFEGGLAVVILAIILDRISHGLINRSKKIQEG
ncbi:ABC transporter permease [Dethiobacter alkaliphilus]|uniref:Binding-protein-dependent transport systems inner membrane component n=1 Tax=Dethiobacter alkaliphilus AHT 1 TaxID=555088 RepID=C0GIS0_DETAL|nr:proline/glycine betaine ABC transporter permease [Dethiobacter alkaliphilus]EEG76734.1 binding-protein-dependent transport systems inner membrane component [Dethiobacter alkaliphilus AHT 1]